MNNIGVGYFETTPRMKELVNEALDNNRLSYGPMGREFERQFARAHNTQYAVLSNSGTSALQVALQAMKELEGWYTGDEVIIPAVTFVATANIVLHNDLVPIPVDIDPYTYNIDTNLVEAAITPRTRAIIPVHLFGQMANMTEVKRISLKHDLAILEDSCECMFATHRGKFPGEYGHIAAFSTYVAHLITTGVGGISTTNMPGFAEKMRSLVNHGRDGIYISVDDDSGAIGDERREIISRRFNFESVGHSFRTTELEAAIGLAQMDAPWDMIERRQWNGLYLTSGLSSMYAKLQTPTILADNTHAFMMYPIVLINESKWELCNHLETHGIETREMLPLVNQPVYSFNESDYPIAKWVNSNGFYVGCHQGLEPQDLDHIIDTITDYFNG